MKSSEGSQDHWERHSTQDQRSEECIDCQQNQPEQSNSGLTDEGQEEGSRITRILSAMECQ